MERRRIGHLFFRQCPGPSAQGRMGRKQRHHGSAAVAGHAGRGPGPPRRRQCGRGRWLLVGGRVCRGAQLCRPQRPDSLGRQLPVRAPTMCAFGGDDAGQMYVTSLVRPQWDAPVPPEGSVLFVSPVPGLQADLLAQVPVMYGSQNSPRARPAPRCPAPAPTAPDPESAPGPRASPCADRYPASRRRFSSARASSTRRAWAAGPAVEGSGPGARRVIRVHEGQRHRARFAGAARQPYIP